MPGSALLKANLTDVDVIEVFNSRIAFPGFNEKAVRFAERHRLPAAAGSDAHVLPGLGTALTGMGEFTGPDDFVEALAAATSSAAPRACSTCSRSSSCRRPTKAPPSADSRRPPAGRRPLPARQRGVSHRGRRPHAGQRRISPRGAK